MKHTMPMNGIQNELAFPSLLYVGLATFLTLRYPQIFIIRFLSRRTMLWLGFALLLIGIPLLARAAYEVVSQFESGELIRGGLFRYVRNPIYAAWIFFVIPGFALLTQSWLFLLTPLVTYAAFKIFIHKEEDYLTARYGDAYLDYKARTGQIFPRLKHKYHEYHE